MSKIIPIRTPWKKGEMTSRERFKKQMNFEPVDRSFNMEFGYWDENYTLWEMFKKNNITTEWDANTFLNFDRIENVWGNVWMDPYFEYKEIERKGDKIIMQNEDGVTGEISTGNTSSIPHFIESAIKTPDDWLKMKKERFDVKNPNRKMDVQKIIEAHPSNRDYPLGINCGSMIGRIRDLLTFEGLCYAYIDYPEMIEDMVETACQLVENSIDQILGKVEFDFASGWEDICYNHGPILPPSFFNEIVAPRYKRIHNRLKNHGIDLWYTDCDGDVRPLLDMFLDSGINCMFPYEVNSCIFPGDLMDEYKTLRIMGGVDKMQLIKGQEATKDYLEKLLPYVKRGGIIPFCDHRCPPDVTEENYIYYLDLKEKLFGGF